MKQFNFNKNLVEIDLAGNIFELDPIAAEKIFMELGNKIKGLPDGEAAAPDPDMVLSVCEDITGALKELLGEGACEKIWKDRAVSFYDCLDLVVFITNEIQSFTNAKIKSYNTAAGAAKK